MLHQPFSKEEGNGGETRKSLTQGVERDLLFSQVLVLCHIAVNLPFVFSSIQTKDMNLIFYFLPVQKKEQGWRDPHSFSCAKHALKYVRRDFFIIFFNVIFYTTLGIL